MRGNRISSSLTALFCVSACANGADVAFVLDASGSIGTAKFHRVTRFVADVVEKLSVVDGASSVGSRLATRVGLVTFSDFAAVEFHLDRYSRKIDVLHALNARFLGGVTSTHDAIR